MNTKIIVSNDEYFFVIAWLGKYMKFISYTFSNALRHSVYYTRHNEHF